jgi:hypothetical protein
VAGLAPHTSGVEAVEPSEPVQLVVPLCTLFVHEHAPHTGLHSNVTERTKRETVESRTT